MPLSLNVNGHTHEIDADPQMPLLWILRDYIGLTGTKYGCGIAQCGACTVHVNGKAVRSCSIPLASIANKENKITTIEGLSPNGDHVLQKTWEQEDVPQCGYCQGGQIMTAAAFLNEHPHPTDEEITRAMSGNLCRCGTYLRIHAAIKKAAQLTNK